MTKLKFGTLIFINFPLFADASCHASSFICIIHFTLNNSTLCKIISFNFQESLNLPEPKFLFFCFLQIVEIVLEKVCKETCLEPSQFVLLNGLEFPIEQWSFSGHYGCEQRKILPSSAQASSST